MGMSPDQWNRVKELYEAALDCRPAERDTFLLKNEPDATVREEVHQLLSERDKIGGFLSTPSLVDRYTSSAPSPPQLSPNEVLAGRYRILNFIAAGGMGEVYKAQDSSSIESSFSNSCQRIGERTPQPGTLPPRSTGRIRTESSQHLHSS